MLLTWCMIPSEIFQLYSVSLTTNSNVILINKSLQNSCPDIFKACIWTSIFTFRTCYVIHWNCSVLEHTIFSRWPKQLILCLLIHFTIFSPSSSRKYQVRYPKFHSGQTRYQDQTRCQILQQQKKCPTKYPYLMSTASGRPHVQLKSHMLSTVRMDKNWAK